MAGMALHARKADSKLTGSFSSSLPRLHQGYELILPGLIDGGVLFPERGEPDARHALAEALRSLADTADALRRLAEVLEKRGN